MDLHQTDAAEQDARRPDAAVQIIFSTSRAVTHTTIGCVWFSSGRCRHKRCYSRSHGYDADWIGGAWSQARSMGEHSPETQSQRPDLVQPESVSCAELDRTLLQQDQGMSGVATRYDKLAANYLAFIQLASIRIWLPANESAL